MHDLLTTLVHCWGYARLLETGVFFCSANKMHCLGAYVTYELYELLLSTLVKVWAHPGSLHARVG